MKFILTAILHIMLFLVLYPSMGNGEKFDPKKVDYCKLNCTEKGKVYQHIACDCFIEEGHNEILTDIAQFRQDVLSVHNELRNYLASGMEQNINAGKATNMRAVNYDLELEYIARCAAGRFTYNRFYTDSEKCKKPQKYNFSGQNFAGNQENVSTFAKNQIREWYAEITHIDGTLIDNYTEPKGAKIYSHFTQIVWASQEYVGCARVWFPDNPDKDYRLVLICNYGSPTGPTNAPGQPVYLKGNKQCSQCPANFTCHKNLTWLCGEIRPAPTDPPPVIIKKKKEKEKVVEKASFAVTVCGNRLLCTILTIILFLY